MDLSVKIDWSCGRRSFPQPRGTGLATVQTDSDPRCCPTGGKRVKVFIQSGRINAQKKEG